MHSKKKSIADAATTSPAHSSAQMLIYHTVQITLDWRRSGDTNNIRRGHGFYQPTRKNQRLSRLPKQKIIKLKNLNQIKQFESDKHTSRNGDEKKRNNSNNNSRCFSGHTIPCIFRHGSQVTNCLMPRF